MLLRRTLIGLAVVLAALVALWVAALRLLPDAAGGRGPVTSAPPQPRVGATLAIPIAGVRPADLRDSWGDPRDNGLRAHHGTDIAAPAGTPVHAAAAGTVEKMWTSVAGGTTLYVRSPDRGWTTYYAHLAGYAPALREGAVVRTGDVIGYVGDTGDAGAGNYHLHFGLTRTTRDQHWYQGQDVDPYPYLVGRLTTSSASPSR